MDDPTPHGDPAFASMDDTRYRAMFDTMFDAMFDQVAVGESIRDADGQIVDFRMVYLNAASLDGAGRSGADLVGRTVLECFPAWQERGLLDRFREVVETGVPYVADRLAYTDVAPEGTEISGYWSLSVVRFGDGYITASREVTHLVADEEARRSEQQEVERNAMAVELLQRAALPMSLPDRAGVELAARYEAAALVQPVGGDWYDAFPLDGELLGLVIGDVSGHGLEAAAFMVQVRNVVRALAFEHRQPGMVLERANQVVLHLGDQSLFATCCYAVLDPATGALAWASAGHLAPLLVSGEVSYLDTRAGPPLGVEEDARFAESTTTLAPDDLLVLFTDGLVEVRARPIKERLEVLARTAEACAGRSPAWAADHLVAAAEDRSDDLALVCARMVTPADGA